MTGWFLLAGRVVHEDVYAGRWLLYQWRYFWNGIFIVTSLVCCQRKMLFIR